MQWIETKVHDEVATLIIDRPDRHGALSPKLLEEIRESLGDVHQEKRIRSVIFTAKGPTFCSGVDVQVFDEIRKLPEHEQLQQWFEYWRQLSETCETMLRFPKPIIAAVDGPAMGAGLALALASDLVITSSTGSFSANATQWGLVGGITTALLNFRIGGALAARMSLTGEAVSPDEAYRIGLVAAPPTSSDQIWVTAMDLAKQTSKGSPQAIQATKRLLNETVGEALLTHLSVAAADCASLCTTESAGEGIDAFIEKREPKWL